MLMARVVGNVWTTQKEEGMDNLKLLIVQPVDLNQEPLGEPIVSIDRIGAGLDELVLVSQGSPAQRLIQERTAPVDAAIVGIVDSFEINNHK